MLKIRRALLSVSDKSNLLELAQFLEKRGVELLASGGTFTHLHQAGVKVMQVSDVTQAPEILDGRVKTLHPKIHGAILARGAQDQETLDEHQIKEINLVVCNLYPFSEILHKYPEDEQLIIENIDIGGPAMIRACAKNFQHRLIVTDPTDYEQIINNFDQLDVKLRKKFATKAFQLTADYDEIIANYFKQSVAEQHPFSSSTHFLLPTKERISLDICRVQDLRYGENPHQLAGLYRLTHEASDLSSIPNSEQLQGKDLSFNNIVDADVALQLVQLLSKPGCVIIKHANPCGVAISESLDQAFKLAFAADPKSAFGGIIALNREVDQLTAQHIIENFCEVIIAPEFSSAALEVFKSKKKLIVLATGCLTRGYRDFTHRYQIQSIHGGYLIQNWDHLDLKVAQISYPNGDLPSTQQQSDIAFGLKVVKYVKSNAIILVKNGQTIGIGAGQPNRSDSCKIAIENAYRYGFDPQDSICIGDAFFPFADSIELLAQAGVAIAIHPGGSIRDQEVLSSAKQHNIIMGLTGVRHFKH